jgi:CheY-like chemotaxis protein
MLVQPHDFDIVLTDLVMPGGVTGLQLARKIRRLQPALRILLTTGSVESPAGMTDGEFPLLLKPYTVESLASALRVCNSSAPMVARCGAEVPGGDGPRYEKGTVPLVPL